MSYLPTNAVPNVIRLRGVNAANSAAVIPANAYITGIQAVNTTANAITGGLKFGTTNGGVDIVAALAVGASVLTRVLDAAMLKSFFSTTVTQTIYIDAVAAWNSGSVDLDICYMYF